jgi:cytochrome c
MKLTLQATVVMTAILVPPPSTAAAQDATEGERAFRRCAACHQVGPDAANRIGPHLNGVVGRKVAAVEGFRYSRAMAASEFAWSEEELAKFLANPRQAIPGTTMVFVGIRDEVEIANLIAFLKQFETDS